ncbi:glutathione peroxidase [Aquimarina agarivorans]|uniref:glutathione peroxidase n=1 Tax=Aquimarina agarivorans TaxID=980584 RepID=UPI000248E625|nr:glutathione peroxidase [Aquimarina agarivorans]
MALLFLASLFGCGKTKTSITKNTAQRSAENSIYQFKVKDLSGSEFDFASLKGKKVMIVNTASKCGLTGQYKQLQQLFDKYADNGFTIVGFPANNFMKQEPGSNKDIAAFCTKNYGVTFPMMGKIDVKGAKQHEVYQFLTKKEKNGYKDNTVKWNFQKYLIDENGYVVHVIPSRTLPNEQFIIDWILKK